MFSGGFGASPGFASRGRQETVRSWRPQSVALWRATSLPQGLGEPSVTRCQGQAKHRLDVDPANRDVFSCHRVSLNRGRDERDQKWRFRIANLEQWSIGSGAPRHAKFLEKLAGDRLGIGFSLEALPAWEFPQATVALVERALTQEVAVTSVDHSGNDANNLLGGHESQSSGMPTAARYSKVSS